MYSNSRFYTVVGTLTESVSRNASCKEQVESVEGAVGRVDTVNKQTDANAALNSDDFAKDGLKKGLRADLI